MSLSRLVILPYKMASQSARSLSHALSGALGKFVRRVRPEGNYKPKERSLIVNYGASWQPPWYTGTCLNKPYFVAKASNKLLSFACFSQEEIVCPNWTTDINIARGWANSGHVVVCRNLLNSHSGRGIVLAGPETPQMPVSPLYVKYKKKRTEYRIHVFRHTIIDATEKRRMRRDWRPDTFDGYIRNHANGWIYARDNVVLPSDSGPLAVDAVAALGLDFGACDVIWNEHENKSYVLEVNTAPGLEGTTLVNYTNAILRWMHAQR